MNAANECKLFLHLLGWNIPPCHDPHHFCMMTMTKRKKMSWIDLVTRHLIIIHQYLTAIWSLYLNLYFYYYYPKVSFFGNIIVKPHVLLHIMLSIGDKWWNLFNLFLIRLALKTCSVVLYHTWYVIVLSSLLSSLLAIDFQSSLLNFVKNIT